MDAVITKFEASQRKPQVTDVRPGDTVRVHQKVREGAKERTQIFEGMVIRTKRPNSLTKAITVRRLASGVGVEKSYFLHSPTIIKVEVVKRTKVRRNFLSYMRERTGKSSRLAEQEFDREATNVKEEEPKAEDKTDGKTHAAEKEDKPTKAELKTEKEAEQKSEKTEKSGRAEEKVKKVADTKKEDRPDKAVEKKAKAEAFRKAQEAKK